MSSKGMLKILNRGEFYRLGDSTQAERALGPGQYESCCTIDDGLEGACHAADAAARRCGQASAATYL